MVMLDRMSGVGPEFLNTSKAEALKLLNGLDSVLSEEKSRPDNNRMTPLQFIDLVNKRITQGIRNNPDIMSDLQNFYNQFNALCDRISVENMSAPLNNDNMAEIQELISQERAGFASQN